MILILECTLDTDSGGKLRSVLMILIAFLIRFDGNLYSVHCTGHRECD